MTVAEILVSSVDRLSGRQAKMIKWRLSVLAYGTIRAAVFKPELAECFLSTIIFLLQSAKPRPRGSKRARNVKLLVERAAIQANGLVTLWQ